MSNLERKPFYQSTVFQVVTLMYMAPAAIMYLGGSITAASMLEALKWGVGMYMAKEVAAKSAEAYRDSQ